MDDCTPYIGYQFNEFFGCMEFIKITTNNELENYNNLLHDGYNEIEFSENYGHISGGIKFVEHENMLQQINSTHMATYIRYVEIPDDANVIVKNDCYMADKLILAERQLISDLDIWTQPHLYKEQITKYPKLVKYIKNIDKDLELILVSKDPSVIEYIENPSEETCIKAVTIQPYLINKIKNPSMDIYKALIKKNAYAINFITPLPEEIMFELIDHNSAVLKYLHSCENLKEIVVSKNGLLLDHISNKTKKLCEIAFKNNPEAIMYIPNYLKTYDMCIKAVEYDYLLFNYVPQQFMNNDLCLRVLDHNPHLLNQIKNPTDEMYLKCSTTIPSLLSKIKNKSIIKDIDPLEIIKIDPNYIKNISEPTYEMCLEAISKNGQLLSIIPLELQNEQMYLMAVKNDGTSIKYIPEEFHKENVCIEALNNNIEAFQYIKNKTNNVIEHLLSLNYCLINHVQDIIIDDNFLQKMKLLCAMKYGLSLQFIKNPSHQMCAYAIEQNYKALQFVPKHLWHDDLIDCALLKNGKALKYITNQNEVMCMEAIENNPLAIKYVDEKFLTNELYIHAIRGNYKAIGKIKNQEIELCLFAVKINEKAIKYIHNLNKELCVHLWCINHKIIEYVPRLDLKNACTQMEHEFVHTFVF